MRVDVIMLSDNEAEIHHVPCFIARVLFGRRAMYTPVVRVEMPHHPSDVRPIQMMWQHKYTSRGLDEPLLAALERLPVIGEVRRALLLAAAQEA